MLYALSDDPFLCGGPGFGGPEILLVGTALVLAAGAFAPFRWGSRLLLLSVVGLVSFALAEAVLVPILGPAMREPYQYDDELIFVTRPGTTKLYRLAEEDGGAVVRSEINDAGYRGPELVDAPDLRVAVYGDSFIHALYAEEDDTFCRRLETHLGEALQGRQVEVVNAGVSSYGPDQALLRMRRELPGLAPRSGGAGRVHRQRLWRPRPEQALSPDRGRWHRGRALGATRGPSPGLRAGARGNRS